MRANWTVERECGDGVVLVGVFGFGDGDEGELNVKSDACSDVTAWPGTRGPAQAKPCEAKLYEAPAGLSGAHSLGFTFLKPQAVAWAMAWVASHEAVILWL